MEEALATDNIPVIDTSSIPADNMRWPADPTWEEIRVEIDRVRPSPADSLAGPGVTFAGRASEEHKHCPLAAAWLLLHPAQDEGWGS